MNDLVDEDTDRNNPRKGNFVFGARLSRTEAKLLPGLIALFNIFPLTIFTILDNSLFYLLWLFLAFCVNFLYNNKPFQLSRRAPWEFPCLIFGHLLIPLLSCKINRLPLPGRGSLFFHVLLLARSHLWLEIMDISHDAQCKKQTVAVILGENISSLLVFLLILIESVVAKIYLSSAILSGFSLFGALLFLGMFLIERHKAIRINKKHVCISQSLLGFLLMLFLWSSGDLLL